MGGQLIYVSDDGKYLVQGTVVDIDTKSELTGSSTALSSYRLGMLQTAPTSERNQISVPAATCYNLPPTEYVNVLNLVIRGEQYARLSSDH